MVIDRGTDPIAAKWNTKRHPAIAFSTAAASRMSPRRKERGRFAPHAARFSTFPPERSSKTETSAPKETRAPVRCDPMNPAPPVTKHREPEKKSACKARQSVSETSSDESFIDEV